MKKMINITGSWKQDFVLRQLFDITIPFGGLNVTIAILSGVVFVIFFLLVLLVKPIAIMFSSQPILTIVGLSILVAILHKGKIDGKTPLLFIVSAIKYITFIMKEFIIVQKQKQEFLSAFENNILFKINKRGGQL